jgi:hypothetical protein
MSRTRDSGGVPIPPARTSDDIRTEGTGEADWGTILTIVLSVISVPVLILFLLYEEPDETGWNMDYAKSAAKACPPISKRIDEMLADGRVTDDEQSIVRTLRDQARAAPGGLETCQDR